MVDTLAFSDEDSLTLDTRYVLVEEETSLLMEEDED